MECNLDRPSFALATAITTMLPNSPTSQNGHGDHHFDKAESARHVFLLWLPSLAISIHIVS